MAIENLKIIFREGGVWGENKIQNRFKRESNASKKGKIEIEQTFTPKMARA